MRHVLLTVAFVLSACSLGHPTTEEHEIYHFGVEVARDTPSLCSSTEVAIAERGLEAATLTLQVSWITAWAQNNPEGGQVPPPSHTEAYADGVLDQCLERGIDQ